MSQIDNAVTSSSKESGSIEKAVQCQPLKNRWPQLPERKKRIKKSKSLSQPIKDDLLICETVME
jgi:hypothetical protein